MSARTKRIAVVLGLLHIVCHGQAHFRLPDDHGKAIGIVVNVTAQPTIKPQCLPASRGSPGYTVNATALANDLILHRPQQPAGQLRNRCGCVLARCARQLCCWSHGITIET